MLLALPAAYALAIRPVPKWRDVLFFFISTKFLPVVASIFPIYVYAEKWNLIGTRTVLIILYIAINLPLAAWMTRSFFIDRKSTRLNSSHLVISYAVFCLKKKKNV